MKELSPGNTCNEHLDIWIGRGLTTWRRTRSITILFLIKNGRLEARSKEVFETGYVVPCLRWRTKFLRLFIAGKNRSMMMMHNLWYKQRIQRYETGMMPSVPFIIWSAFNKYQTVWYDACSINNIWLNCTVWTVPCKLNSSRLHYDAFHFSSVRLSHDACNIVVWCPHSIRLSCNYNFHFNHMRWMP